MLVIGCNLDGPMWAGRPHRELATSMRHLRPHASSWPYVRGETWLATLAGVTLTVLLALLVDSGLTDRDALSRLRGTVRRARMAPAERLSFVDVPPAPQPMSRPAAGTLARSSPRRSRGVSALGSLPVIAAPVAPVELAPSASPLPRPPGPLIVPRTPPMGASGPATCLGPCAGATNAGMHMRGPPPLEGAAVGERLRELSRTLPELARLQPPISSYRPPPPEPQRDRTRLAPPPMGIEGGGSSGVSLLPGGGPSAAQRKRWREQYARTSAILARVRARIDSLRRDSVARLEGERPGL